MSMTFTMQEHELMVTNTKRIEEYIRSVMPRLREGFTIGFGEMVHRGRCNEIYEHNYELHIDKKYLCGHIGGLGVQFAESGDRNFTVYLYSDRAYSDGYMSSLIKEWATIKAKIMEYVAKQNDTVNAIYKFEL